MSQNPPQRDPPSGAGRHIGDGNPIELANHLLASHPPGSAQQARGLELLFQAAEGPRAAEAAWYLGAYYLQVGIIAGADKHAAHWLERAAAGSIAPAIDRLADLHLKHSGPDHAPMRALALKRRLADHGVQTAAWEAGYLLSSGETGLDDPAAAATAFARACALGYPPAYYSLGLRFALGSGVASDRSLARALLLRAADAGFPDARQAAEDLAPAEASGAEAERWYHLLKENLLAAQSLRRQLTPPFHLDEPGMRPVVLALERHFAALGHPALFLAGDGRLGCIPTDDGHTLAPGSEVWNPLAMRPRVLVRRNFATREECAHLMFKAAGMLVPAERYRKRGSVNDDAEVLAFSGRGSPLGPMHSDAVIRRLESRLITETGWPPAALEPCSIIRYLPGEEYRPHVDYFEAEQIARNAAELGDCGGQRLATFLLYLRAPEEGGETVYERTGVVVSGERGLAVVHYNVTPEGTPDPLSLHSGRPINRGEKWLWRSTLRERPLFPPAPQSWSGR